MQALRIIVTGGTLDKVHDIHTEGLGFAPTEQTHLPEILQQARCIFPVVELLMLKDSADFDDADRQALADVIMAAPEQAVVITHGTSTMGRTARFLTERVREKTVVLTGAMRPFSLGQSDATFNVGSAIIAAQHLRSGIWGVMNGRVFAAELLDKNTTTGRFDA